jgi:hypothetical protein
VAGRPAFLWGLAALFATRVAVLTALAPDRPDARNWWMAGRLLLTDPGSLYPLTADIIAHTHRILVPGTAGFLGPPAQVFLAAPYALLPQAVGVQLWTLTDALLAGLGLYLLYRHLDLRSPVARPAFWLAAAFFPPLFADLDAGQRGGAILCVAMLAISLESRPWLSGLATGVAATLKFYPAAMLIGVRPQHRIRFLISLSASFGAIFTLTFIPFGNPLTYVRGVLIPAASVSDPDCGIDSVSSLWHRTAGGEAYALPAESGVRMVQLPLHFPALATALTLLTVLCLVVAAVWAARASGWSPVYGMGLGFALGALIPSEVYPYQFLPLLPLAVMTVAMAVERQRWGVVAVAAILLLGFVRQPCDLPFPNLWTVAGLGVFVLGVWQYRLFRTQQHSAGGAGGGHAQ